MKIVINADLFIKGSQIYPSYGKSVVLTQQEKNTIVQLVKRAYGVNSVLEGLEGSLHNNTGTVFSIGSIASNDLIKGNE